MLLGILKVGAALLLSQVHLILFPCQLNFKDEFLGLLRRWLHRHLHLLLFWNSKVRGVRCTLAMHHVILVLLMMRSWHLTLSKMGIWAVIHHVTSSSSLLIPCSRLLLVQGDFFEVFPSCMRMCTDWIISNSYHHVHIELILDLLFTRSIEKSLLDF